MLETPEARAKLRRKLETWPDDRKSPVTINQGLELLDMIDSLEENLHKIELHEHDMMQWAKLDMEEAKKTIDWVQKMQEILGMEIGMTKNSYTEITAKIKELITIDKEANWLAEFIANLHFSTTKEANKSYLSESVKRWRRAAEKAVKQENGGENE